MREEDNALASLSLRSVRLMSFYDCMSSYGSDGILLDNIEAQGLGQNYFTTASPAVLLGTGSFLLYLCIGIHVL